MYAFGFGLTIQALFFLSPIAGGCKNLFFYSPYFFARRRFFSFAVLFFVCRIVFMYAHGRSQKTIRTAIKILLNSYPLKH